MKRGENLGRRSILAGDCLHPESPPIHPLGHAAAELPPRAPQPSGRATPPPPVVRRRRPSPGGAAQYDDQPAPAGERGAHLPSPPPCSADAAAAAGLGRRFAPADRAGGETPTSRGRWRAPGGRRARWRLRGGGGHCAVAAAASAAAAYSASSPATEAGRRRQSLGEAIQRRPRAPGGLGLGGRAPRRPRRLRAGPTRTAGRTTNARGGPPGQRRSRAPPPGRGAPRSPHGAAGRRGGGRAQHSRAPGDTPLQQKKENPTVRTATAPGADEGGDLFGQLAAPQPPRPFGGDVACTAPREREGAVPEILRQPTGVRRGRWCGGGAAGMPRRRRPACVTARGVDRVRGQQRQASTTAGGRRHSWQRLGGGTRVSGVRAAAGGAAKPRRPARARAPRGRAAGAVPPPAPRTHGGRPPRRARPPRPRPTRSPRDRAKPHTRKRTDTWHS